MGTLFRSEEMTLCQLFLQTESAYSCVAELGELGLVQFRDLNPEVNAFQRKFVNEVRRCAEMDRILKFAEREAKKDKITIPEASGNCDAPAPKEMSDLEMTFEKLEVELREASLSLAGLKKTYLELIELRHILRKAQVFFEEHEYGSFDLDSSQSALVSAAEGHAGHTSHLGFMAGVIHREKLQSFETMLWRVCRGNAFMKFADIDLPMEDPKTGDMVLKSVFVVFYQGEQLKSRTKKICEGFRASLYPCPDTTADRRAMANEVMTRIEDLNVVMKETQGHRNRILSAAAKNVSSWQCKVRKMKAVYHILNMCNFDVTHKCLIGEGWCSVPDVPRVQLALRRGTEQCGGTAPSVLNLMETSEVPPTYNKTNKFTRGFQAIVDAYGISDYREVNPAPYTIITFPFLFAVMFGDCGHGLIMALFALWMVLKEKELQASKSDNEIWNTFFNGRYIILLMGCFSIYTGLIYNDVFSKSFNIFGTSWMVPYDLSIYGGNNSIPIEMVSLDPIYAFGNHSYPFGLDPIWQLAQNKILYLNSYKMKGSIILGVGQMIFGVSLSVINHAYFRKPLNIICEFIPQLIFLVSIFGYLVILIFYKWVNFNVVTANCAPSLLIHLINMFLFSYQKEPCYLNLIYPGQNIVQPILVILAVLCIPWMLLVKPLYLRRQANAAHNQQFVQMPSSVVQLEDVLDSESSHGNLNGGPPKAKGHNSDGHGGHGEHGEFNFGEIFIHQAIHTIEYCLGSISHTASYLRLWALSLAHAQLSDVLWTMVFRIGLSMTSYVGCIAIYILFAAWAVLTVAILLVMEGLSAFLHALRLHWVEFQSKFYGGTGYLFEPFSFQNLSEEFGGKEE